MYNTWQYGEQHGGETTSTAVFHFESLPSSYRVEHEPNSSPVSWFFLKDAGLFDVGHVTALAIGRVVGMWSGAFRRTFAASLVEVYTSTSRAAYQTDTHRRGEKNQQPQEESNEIKEAKVIANLLTPVSVQHSCCHLTWTCPPYEKGQICSTDVEPRRWCFTSGSFQLTPWDVFSLSTRKLQNYSKANQEIREIDNV